MQVNGQKTTTQTPKHTHTDMNEMMGLLTRLVVAIELIAGGANAAVPAAAAAAAAAAAEAGGGETPKGSKGKKAATPKEEPAVDYEKVREKCKAVMSKVLEDDASRGASLKKLIVKHGGEKLSSVPESNLEALLSDLEAVAEL